MVEPASAACEEAAGSLRRPVHFGNPSEGREQRHQLGEEDLLPESTSNASCFSSEVDVSERAGELPTLPREYQACMAAGDRRMFS